MKLLCMHDNIGMSCITILCQGIFAKSVPGAIISSMGPEVGCCQRQQMFSSITMDLGGDLLSGAMTMTMICEVNWYMTMFNYVGREWVGEKVGGKYSLPFSQIQKLWSIA